MKQKRFGTPIFLDYHSTTPLDPRVIRVMQESLVKDFGNASSQSNLFGQTAYDKAEAARKQAAALIHAAPDEIIFTGSATEANNLAIKGVAQKYRDRGSHIITQVTEHKAVLEVCRCLEKQGMQVTYLPVDAYGQVRLEDLQKAITPQTILISIMTANNEIGTLQPVEKIGKIAKNKGIFFHTDAVQAVGKIPVNVQKLGVDLLSFSGHKMYGPKGAAVLYVRKENPRVRLEPQTHGGSQEQGMRAGTMNVPAVIGLGKACEIAARDMSRDELRIRKLRDEFCQKLVQNLEGVTVNGHPAERLAGNLNVCFGGVNAPLLLQEIKKDIAVSMGSACLSKSPEPSHVLKAIGITPDRLHSVIRFGFGRFTSRQDIQKAATIIVSAVRKLRKSSPWGS